MTLDWLSDFTETWRRRAGDDRLPHALLLIGPRGVGKRSAAAWLAALHLGLKSAQEGPGHPLRQPEHADLRWLRPPEGKHHILIDQMRELIAELGLTSYEGRGKVAVIDFAHTMTTSSANSLLKTLEEPSGNSLICLVADRVDTLPATILSRCERVTLAVPPLDASRRWLERIDGAFDWTPALEAAGGAPLAALAVKDEVPVLDGMRADFAALAEGRGTPLEVAARWKKIDPDTVLDWLSRHVQSLIRERSGVRAGRRTDVTESVLRRIDTPDLFCYLDIINGLRARPPGSYDPALALESLLIQWSGGLVSTGRTHAPGELLPGTTTDW